jgi:hypothetical protein
MRGKELIKYFTKFERKSAIVIGLSMFAFGVATGFYIYGILQGKLEVLAPAAIVIAILTWFGRGTDFLGLLQDWLKEKKEAEKVVASQPRLKIMFDPDTDPDTYCPVRSYHNPRHLGQTIHRKFLRVVVENSGGGVAAECVGILKIKLDQPFGSPLRDEKELPWKTLRVKEDLGVGNHQTLDVLFSDDREFKDSKDDRLAKKAFISTLFNTNFDNIRFPKIEDGFNIGEFEFELTTRDKNGFFIYSVFRVMVTYNWNEISMKRIE